MLRFYEFASKKMDNGIILIAENTAQNFHFF